jgi:hypothetical protein
VGGAEERGEDLLSGGTTRAAIAAADLRRTTAGRIACSARQLVASTAGSPRKVRSAAASVVRCAAKRGGHRGARGDQIEQREQQPAAGDREAVCGDGPRGVTVPQREALGQQGVDPRRKRTAWMIGLQRATATQMAAGMRRPA